MTKKALVKIIQEVVRREVQKEVNKLFIKENKSSLKSLAPKKKVVKKKRVQYTDNKSLNDILNETVGLSKGDSEMDYSDLMKNDKFKGKK